MIKVGEICQEKMISRMSQNNSIETQNKFMSTADLIDLIVT